MVTPKGKCEQWQCHATRDQVPQPNAALDGLPDRSVWERLKSARSWFSKCRDDRPLQAESRNSPVAAFRHLSAGRGVQKKGLRATSLPRGVIMVVATSAPRSSCTLRRSPPNWNG